MKSKSVLLLIAGLLTSCVGIFQLRGSNNYNFLYKGVWLPKGDTITFKNDVLYYPGDTLVLLPSKKQILILDISLNRKSN